MTDARQDEQIIVDALKAERAKLDARLTRLKEASTMPDVSRLSEIYKAAAKVDTKSPDAVHQIKKLAEQEAEIHAAIERFNKRDLMKDIDARTKLQIEIASIDGLVARHSLRMALHDRH